MIFAVAPFGRAAVNRTASSWKQTCAPENGAALGHRTRSGPRLPVAVHAPPFVRLLAPKQRMEMIMSDNTLQQAHPKEQQMAQNDVVVAVFTDHQ